MEVVFQWQAASSTFLFQSLESTNSIDEWESVGLFGGLGGGGGARSTKLD